MISVVVVVVDGVALLLSQQLSQQVGVQMSFYGHSVFFPSTLLASLTPLQIFPA